MSNKIYKITPAGVVSALAGSGTYGYADGTSTTAEFSYSYSLIVASDYTLYVADSGNSRVRKISQ